MVGGLFRLKGGEMALEPDNDETALDAVDITTVSEANDDYFDRVRDEQTFSRATAMKAGSRAVFQLSILLRRES